MASNKRNEFPYYADILNDLSRWWYYAGEDVRKVFLTELDKRICGRKKDERLRSAFGKANYDRAIDYSNDIYRSGDCCVYAWVSEQHGLFYIGSVKPRALPLLKLPANIPVESPLLSRKIF